MAAKDCEFIGTGLLGQPVNTVTAVAFVVAGLVVFRKPRSRWVGAALIATGIGSILFHGPMPAMATWAHDVSLAWLILVIAGLGQSWERWTRVVGLVTIASILALVPLAAIPVAVILTVLAGLTQGFWGGRRQTIVAFALIGLFALFGRLGATGGPLCDPKSIFQPHSIWHVGAATIVAWWIMRLDLDPLVVR